MKKMILVFVMLLGLGFVNVSANNFVKYSNTDINLLDFEDSGEPEYILLDFEDSGEPEYILLDFEDSGEPEYILLDFEDSGEPEYILLNSSFDSNKQISQFHNPLDLGKLAKFEDSGEPEFVPTRSFVWKK